MCEQVAIVSGAAGGLGGAIAERLAADGFSVAGCDVVANGGPDGQEKLDVTDPAAVREFVSRVEAGRGPVEVVVTAAGVQRTGPSQAVTDDEWRLMLDVNLIIALTKSLARELAPRGICVNSVAPGPIDIGTFRSGPVNSDAWIAANIPLGRAGRPDEVAACVSLLAGEGGGYFVGQVLSPNGGTAI